MQLQLRITQNLILKTKSKNWGTLKIGLIDFIGSVYGITTSPILDLQKIDHLL
jgi:hypothetical protein